ncbi:LAFA_0G23904g1_1 [Lachancea sp. 'fantastica']|nr:LAFA_0G23904g1_1 [Lachancea sp. 'fantastica']
MPAPSNSHKRPQDPFFKTDDDGMEILHFLQNLQYLFFLDEIEEDSRKIKELIRRARDSTSVSWCYALLNKNSNLEELTFEEVLKSFQAAHISHKPQWKLWAEFLELKQQGTIVEYTDAFTRKTLGFSPDTPIPDHILLWQYIAGLKEPFRQRVLSVDPLNLSTAQKAALGEAWILEQQQIEEATTAFRRNYSTSTGPNHDKLMQRRVTKTVKNRRHPTSKLLCFNCNRPGHYIRECPIRSQ